MENVDLILYLNSSSLETNYIWLLVVLINYDAFTLEYIEVNIDLICRIKALISSAWRRQRCKTSERNDSTASWTYRWMRWSDCTRSTATPSLSCSSSSLLNTSVRLKILVFHPIRWRPKLPKKWTNTFSKSKPSTDPSFQVTIFFSFIILLLFLLWFHDDNCIIIICIIHSY